MGTWGTAIKSNDTFADAYADFFDLYNKGDEPGFISSKLIEENQEVIEAEEDQNNFWFALALAQWETKSLDPEILSRVENIITSGADLKIWLDLGADARDIKRRTVALEKFLEKIKSERQSIKPRKKRKSKVPVFATGDCLVFKLSNGNFGGAVVLAVDSDPYIACNLVVVTRLNQSKKPTIKDFQKAAILICNSANWKDRACAGWYWPDSFYPNYADVYERIGNIPVELAYDPRNEMSTGGYHFNPFSSGAWNMNIIAERQFEYERTNPRSANEITIRQLTRRKTWMDTLFTKATLTKMLSWRKFRS